MNPDFANPILNECFKNLEKKDANGFANCADKFLNGEIDTFLHNGAHLNEMRDFLNQAREKISVWRDDKAHSSFAKIVNAYSRWDKDFTDKFSLVFGKRDIVSWLDAADSAIKENDAKSAKHWLELCEGKLIKAYGEDGMKVFGLRKNETEKQLDVKKTDYWDWYRCNRKFKKLRKTNQ